MGARDPLRGAAIEPCRSTRDPLGDPAPTMAHLAPETPTDGLPRRYFSLQGESLRDTALAIPTVEGHFVLFLACDGTSLSDDELQEFSIDLLGKGIAYLVAWGPDCARVHDVFDLAEVECDLEGEGPTVMTSWHAGESLEEAFYYFLFTAWPDEAFESTCNTAIAASVDNSEWSTRIRELFSDVAGLKTEVGV